MDNILLINSNSCCNALLKISFWLILAKYKSSKLQVIKRATEDAALNEFETRLYLRKHCLSYEGNDQFLNFTRNVYNKAALLISNYISNPEWSIFCDEGNNSIWQLNNIIQNELTMAISAFSATSHPNCNKLFYVMKEQIFSTTDSWLNAGYLYSNYVNAVLSHIFAEKVKAIFCKYENFPYNYDLKWICDDVMSELGARKWNHTEKNPFWFLAETLTYENEPFFSPYNKEEDPVTTLSNWLYKESVADFKKCTKALIRSGDRYKNEYSWSDDEMRVFRKEQLSTFLNVPIVNLELHLSMSTANGLSVNFDISEGPHYYMPASTVTELQTVMERKVDEALMGESVANEEPPDAGTTALDPLDTILDDCEKPKDIEYENKISEIKSELEGLYGKLDSTNSYETRRSSESDEEKSKKRKASIISVSELEIENEGPDTKRIKGNDYPPQRRKRGRPKKIDSYASCMPKTVQHKYSDEEVKDCSKWISENFYEVSGIKPAIDRARMYELYTQFCLLKYHTHVDRALFGKIIRKVFPRLRSRRLIQNQVLRYHYVGLKPKYSELETALSFPDTSSMNPNEIILTYEPSGK